LFVNNPSVHRPPTRVLQGSYRGLNLAVFIDVTL